MIAKPNSTQTNAYDIRRIDGTVLHARSPQQIREMAVANDLFADDMICRCGDDHWRPASSLAGLPIQTRREVLQPVVAAVHEEPVVVVDRMAEQAEERARELEATNAELRATIERLEGTAEAVALAQERAAVEHQAQLDALQIRSRSESERLAAQLGANLESAHEASIAHQIETATLLTQVKTLSDELAERPNHSEIHALKGTIQEQELAHELTSGKLDEYQSQLASSEHETASVRVAHEREIANARATHEREIANARVAHEREIAALREESARIAAELETRPPQSAIDALESALRERDMAQLKSAESIAQYRQQVAATAVSARDAHIAHEIELTQVRSQVESLSNELRTRPDPSIVAALEAAVQSRDAAQATANDVSAQRDGLLAGLAHSQDAVRAGDELRRALEASIASLTITAKEHCNEIERFRASDSDLRGAYSKLLARTEAAEASVVREQQLQSDANAAVARTMEQCEIAVKARDCAVADRDSAFAERDSTRLAVGATQTDLIRVRREFESLRGEFESACAALSEQTARAAALESATAATRAQSDGLALELASANERVGQLQDSARDSARDFGEQAVRGEQLQQRLEVLELTSKDLANARDSARVDAEELQRELASVRESAVLEAQRVTAAQRELAEERSRVVARDELIFRESLRSEERETENRKQSASLAALRADHDTQQRRADDATAQVAALQRDLQEARDVSASQHSQVTDASKRADELTNLEQAARAALVAASRERDELSIALATAHAAITSREQQVAAERGLRDQAEGSSRQLLASYEKLADDTGRRITDLEIRLTEANHTIQTLRTDGVKAVAALSEADAQAKSAAQKYSDLDEQRGAIVRDRDSYAKRAAHEAAGRAAAEDKIAAANERAAKAQREARTTHERAVQVAMVALNGVKQRLDEDYTKSRSEVDTLEQLVAEASKKVIESGGTLPGLPLLPRDAAAKAEESLRVAAATKAAAEAKPVAATDAQAAPRAALGVPAAHAPRVDSQRQPAAPTNFRMIDSDFDEPATQRPQSARTPTPTAPARAGGQRERVSQPNAGGKSASSDDESSSASQEIGAPSATPKAPRAHTSTTRPPVESRRTGAGADIDEAWIDDHSTCDAAESSSRIVGLLSLTALGVVFTASIAAIPEFAAMNFPAAFTRIAAWVIAVPAVVSVVHATAKSCEPMLARRIPVLASIMLLLAPLATLVADSSPWVGGLIFVGAASIPWLICYAAWPDGRRTAAESLTRRAMIASIFCSVFGAIGIAAAFAPWVLGSASAIGSPTGGCFAALLTSMIACALTPTLRTYAPLAAWGGLALMAALLCGMTSAQGATAVVATIAPTAWIALLAAWCAVAASSLSAACTPGQVAESLAASNDDDAPALVAHERVHAAWTMFCCAVLPLMPALAAFHLARGRSRRAESQLRSLANFEIWFVIALAASALVGLVFSVQIGASLAIGLIGAHAAVCVAAGITMFADRFVRFPTPAALLARPGGGLDLPTPLVTIQRTAKYSPHRPIVHPCGTTAWGAVTIAIGCLAVAGATRSAPLTLSVGPILGLALWVPSLIASRCRHQDTIVICALATLLGIIFSIAGLALNVHTVPENMPTLVAIGGATTGVWALLVGWAFKGMAQMSTLLHDASHMERDECGETIAPVERAVEARRRERLLQRAVIGASGLSAAASLLVALPATLPIVISPALVCGSISLALSAIVWWSANQSLQSRLTDRAGLFASMLAASSFFVALPLFFRATEIGALGALSALPFAAVAALGALLTAGILNSMRAPKTLPRERKPIGVKPSRRHARTARVHARNEAENEAGIEA